MKGLRLRRLAWNLHFSFSLRNPRLGKSNSVIFLHQYGERQHIWRVWAHIHISSPSTMKRLTIASSSFNTKTINPCIPSMLKATGPAQNLTWGIIQQWRGIERMITFKHGLTNETWLPTSRAPLRRSITKNNSIRINQQYISPLWCDSLRLWYKTSSFSRNCSHHSPLPWILMRKWRIFDFI